ncbi:FAD/NAD(P)-binding domain-containing protein [Mytilinidion resinicola]|uniref:FAD/NAD(P)-binding domain-containing protein n=1 Tax=Mytilinidion resinicola TaxID=574789 RepID=A0A6A6YHA8_9PEZI|nr:FAD/NAD(P)-binding domain-containing protein [Mytilinidion resinicola]KAF2807395.1 FAD/NAD(P)-binding domain-containing protein [Mytilinidion resinicola]
MRVLISGAGIAGPTLAWFLAKAGARITIVEKSHSLLPHGQNVDIEGGALTVIKKMGLMDRLRQFNTTEKGTQFISPTGQPFASFPISKGPGRSVSLTSDFEILRADLAAILHEATKDLPNVKYLFGTMIKKVVSNDGDSVKVELSNGEVQDFDLLVAADGQWSKVRKQCFPPDSVNVIHKGNYVAYWTVPRLPIDNDWWNIYLALPSRFMSIRPDPHSTIRALFSLMPCNSSQEKAWLEASKSDRQTQQDLLRREFVGSGWQAERLLDAMDQAPDFYFHEIAQIKMSKWFTSRVVCLGDAAYAPTPLTGMGTSLAITGAYILAGELSKLDDGEHLSKALEAYESIFRPFVEKTQQIPFFFPAIAHPETAWKRWLIQALVWAFSKLMAIPWLAMKIGDHGYSENFSLPKYPSFDEGDAK